jgi:ubiquinone/menaquinone biosynthesis C-methylase UbiE
MAPRLSTAPAGSTDRRRTDHVWTGHPDDGGLSAVEGYDSSTYGDRWADVYDSWYSDLGDADFARRLAEVLGDRHGARVCELGVGTGRLMELVASERRDRGDLWFGVDSSEAMLRRLTALRPGLGCTVTCADMSRRLPDGPFDLIYCGYNTILNLPDDRALADTLSLVASALEPDGDFLVDAVEAHPEDPERVTIRSMTADTVVLSASRADPATGRIEGHFVELTHGGPVRLRPWVVRHWTAHDIDRIAESAGLVLSERHADGRGSPWGPGSTRHVSRYRRR